MTHMGCSSKPEALIRQSLRAGLSDGWGGSMMGTEFSDVLFGTPREVETEANLGVMVAENVNIVVHGHDPSLSEMICEYADSKEMIDYWRSPWVHRELPCPVYAVLPTRLQCVVVSRWLVTFYSRKT